MLSQSDVQKKKGTEFFLIENNFSKEIKILKNLFLFPSNESKKKKTFSFKSKHFVLNQTTET